MRNAAALMIALVTSASCATEPPVAPLDGLLSAHAWAPGSFRMNAAPGTTVIGGHFAGASPQTVEATLQGMQLHLIAGSAGLEAWATIGSVADPVLAMAPVVPGQPLVLAFSSSLESSCRGDRLDDAVFHVDGHDTDGDGTVDRLEGTWSGTWDRLDGDCWCSRTDAEGALDGVADGDAPTPSIQAGGEWPYARVQIAAAEPIPLAAMEAAVSHTVDGAPAPFTFTTTGGVPGASRSFRLVPQSPYMPGAHVQVTMSPMADLAGNVGEWPLQTKTLDLPPFPDPKVGAQWDFSQGLPFEGTAHQIEVSPSFGPVAAPTGGAMAIWGYDSPPDGDSFVPFRAPLSIPPGAQTLRVVMARAGTSDASWFDLSVALTVESAVGEVTSTFWQDEPQSTATADIDGAGWTVSPFEALSLDVSALAGQIGYLRIGPRPAAGVSCHPEPPSVGSGRWLLDRIEIE